MRSLSNPEYVQFLADNPSVSGMLAGTSTVISWGGMSVLVYVGPNEIEGPDGGLYPDIYLSDVSDAPQLAALTGTPAPTQSMLDALPSSVSQTIAAEAAQAGALLNSAGQSAAALLEGVASTIGQTAANLTSPLTSSLTVPIIAAVVILALMYLPKRS
jgi:hypothetical protein